jgi:hypothetical protein
VSDIGLKADPKMVQAITAFPSPNDPFLSMSKTAARCLQLWASADFIDVSQTNFLQLKPLRKLTLKDTPCLWEAPQENALQETKRIMSRAPVLAFADFSLPDNIRVCTNASKIGLGGVLTQVDRENVEKPSTSHLELPQDLKKKTTPRLHLNSLVLSTSSLFSTSTWLVGSLSCLQITVR